MKRLCQFAIATVSVFSVTAATRRRIHFHCVICFAECENWETSDSMCRLNSHWRSRLLRIRSTLQCPKRAHCVIAYNSDSVSTDLYIFGRYILQMICKKTIRKVTHLMRFCNCTTLQNLDGILLRDSLSAKRGIASRPSVHLSICPSVYVEVPWVLWGWTSSKLIANE